MLAEFFFTLCGLHERYRVVGVFVYHILRCQGRHRSQKGMLNSLISEQSDLVCVLLRSVAGRRVPCFLFFPLFNMTW